MAAHKMDFVSGWIRTQRRSLFSVSMVFSGHSASPKSDSSPTKVSKKDKKKEKKEKKKKKEKKEKKEKRKKKRSKVSDSESEEGENQLGKASPADDDHADGGGKNSSDEELWGFFENMSKKSTPADVLMEKMKKKNEARLKRLKEIDEDKKKHQ